jgi:hypothetical protein
VAVIGICFAIAYLAHRFGYSVALGAFIAGSLIASIPRSFRSESSRSWRGSERPGSSRRGRGATRSFRLFIR